MRLAQQLIHDIPDNVTVLAYNMSFEKGVIEKLALSFPDLSERLKSIIPNIRDLMVPFQKGHYVTPSMNGSYSIKYVLPALVPEMAQAYKQLDGVQNGGEAMNAYAKTCDNGSAGTRTYPPCPPRILQARYIGDGQGIRKIKGNIKTLWMKIAT